MQGGGPPSAVGRKAMGGTGRKFTAMTAAAAAVGTYWFYGPEGERHRKEIRGWSLRMKGEILEKLEGLKRVERASYHRVVDRVASRYEKIKKINRFELEQLVRELKDAWGIMTRDLAELRDGEEKKGDGKAVEKREVQGVGS
jgi:hypothetical protein